MVLLVPSYSSNFGEEQENKKSYRLQKEFTMSFTNKAYQNAF